MWAVMSIIFLAVPRLCSAAANESVPEGYWRVSSLSPDLLRCPYGDTACEGGSASEAGTFLCAEGFGGLLCGEGAAGHFVDWVLRDAQSCPDVSPQSLLLPALLLPAGLVLVLLLLVCGLEPLIGGRGKERTGKSRHSSRGAEGQHNKSEGG
eukprot:CAMPEP_0173332204 /NCGR_PEP_ID=MMETSP1144-20121109/4232_1 /TAXON_ID=483371 /ORGANISM="non described non described, Strain CCMP2298" /LENGTH=151 /DNA_ID=CAMNT_0014277081 /DNA_START=111 /DNA_END=562 /DNA_ORIENTATION=-